jgi:(-)-germacrene D synthase
MCCLILILEQLSILIRWDEQAAEQLPDYMKFFYSKVLATMKVIEKDLDSQGNKHADYVKKLVS